MKPVTTDADIERIDRAIEFSKSHQQYYHVLVYPVFDRLGYPTWKFVSAYDQSHYVWRRDLDRGARVMTIKYNNQYGTQI